MGEEQATPPVIDGFSDLTLIGHGGFSTVYAATQEDFGRRVAVKVLNLDPTAARRLQREALALGALGDLPHVVAAHTTATTLDGRPALVMQLMATSIAAEIARYGPLNAERVLTWAQQIGRGLSGAHTRSVFHRDIKPANVLLSTSGDAYLADFGISTIEQLGAHTATALSLSPLYAPPERLAGEVEDPRAGDVYSLAATLYAALSGAPPFGTTADGGVFGLTRRVVDEELPVSPHIHPTLHLVLAQGMAKAPGDRPRTVEELVAQLLAANAADETIRRVRPLQAAPPVVVPPPAPPAPTAPATPPALSQAATSDPPARSTKSAAPLAIAAGLVAMIGIAVGIWAAVAGDSDRAESSPTTAAATTTSTTTTTTTTTTIVESVFPTSAELLALDAPAQIAAVRSRFPGLENCVDEPSTAGTTWQPHIACNKVVDGVEFSVTAWAPDPGGGMGLDPAFEQPRGDGYRLYAFNYDNGLNGRQWQYDGDPFFLMVLSSAPSAVVSEFTLSEIELHRP